MPVMIDDTNFVCVCVCVCVLSVIIDDNNCPLLQH